MIFDMLSSGLRKDNSRILTSQQLDEFLSAGAMTKSGATVTPSKAMTLPWVFACVRVLAETMGQLPLHLHEKRDGKRRIADDHPLYSILYHAPNGFMSSLEFWEWVVACLALRGNAYAFITRVRGEVRELLPIAPGACAPKMLEDGGTIAYDVNLKSGVKRFSADEVLHIKLFTLDGYTGLSPVGYARETIGFGLAQQEHGARLFSNSARPGGLLTTEKQLSKDAAKRLRDDVEELVGGNENAHRLLVLGEGMKFTQMGMTSEDAQWLESRKFTRSEVAGLYRVPPHFIADLERSTFSNVENQDLSLLKHTMVPYLRRSEQRIWMQLLSPDEKRSYYARFNQDALMRGDAKTRAEALQIEVMNGVRSPNEWRELNDTNPREGGDIYLTPSNMVVGAGALGIGKPAALPAGEATPAEGGTAAGAEVVQDTALNGAQVQALQAIIAAVAAGQLPASTARAMIHAAFPALDDATIDAMLDGLEEFEPATPAGEAPADPPPATPP